MFLHELSKLLSNKLKCTIINLKVDIEWVYTIAVIFMLVALVIH